MYARALAMWAYHFPFQITDKRNMNRVFQLCTHEKSSGCIYFSAILSVATVLRPSVKIISGKHATWIDTKRSRINIGDNRNVISAYKLFHWWNNVEREFAGAEFRLRPYQKCDPIEFLSGLLVKAVRTAHSPFTSKTI